MPYKLFVIDHKPGLDGEEQKSASYLRNKLAIAESLGLKAQSASIKADIAAIERGCIITTAPLTDAELTIWRAWLPTVYTDIGGDRRHQLADYRFDRIPQPVLKLWQKHKESGAFERFEIWTPGNQQPDPILVGVNGNSRHLLARWCESGANLVSFDDIKRELVRRRYKDEDIIGGEDFIDERTIDAMFAAVCATVFAVAFYGIALMFNSISSAISITFPVICLLMVAIVIATGVSTFIYVRRKLTKRCLVAASRLM